MRSLLSALLLMASVVLWGCVGVKSAETSKDGAGEGLVGLVGIDRLRTYSKQFTSHDGGKPYLSQEWKGNVLATYHEKGYKESETTYSSEGRIQKTVLYDATGNKEGEVTYDSQGREINRPGVRELRYEGDYLDILRQFTKQYGRHAHNYGGKEVLDSEWRGDKQILHTYDTTGTSKMAEIIFRYEGINNDTSHGLSSYLYLYTKRYVSINFVDPNTPDEKEYLAGERKGDTNISYDANGNKVLEMTTLFDSKGRIVSLTAVRYITPSTQINNNVYTYQ